MNTRIDLPARDWDKVLTVLEAHLPASTRVGVFGSRAKGRARRGSDLDLVIDAGRRLSRDEELALAFSFEDSDLPIRVDVVDRQAVSPTFWAAVEGEVVWVPLSIR